jgi:hypothetical protein
MTAVHRAALVGWMEKIRAALDDFNPDFVLIWGDDQYENFREDIIPPYCVSAFDKFVFSPPADNVWGETDKTYELAGNRGAAKMLTTSLLEQGFDTAYAYKPLHHSLGHAFTNAVFYVDYDRKGFPYPIVPFAINCYGRKGIAQRGAMPTFDKEVADSDLDPPAPTPWRLFDLGAATARILAESPYRVALLASSAGFMRFLWGKIIICILTRRRIGRCTTIWSMATTGRGGTIRVERSRTAASRKSSTGCASWVRSLRSTESQRKPGS